MNINYVLGFLPKVVTVKAYIATVQRALYIDNVEIENSMRRPQIGKRPKKKKKLWIKLSAILRGEQHC